MWPFKRRAGWLACSIHDTWVTHTKKPDNYYLFNYNNSNTEFCNECRVKTAETLDRYYEAKSKEQLEALIGLSKRVYRHLENCDYKNHFELN